MSAIIPWNIPGKYKKKIQEPSERKDGKAILAKEKMERLFDVHPN